MFSGPDVGTTFEVKASKPDGSPYPLPRLTLPRGARHLSFMPGGRSLVVLRGELRHKDLWLIDLTTGAEHRLSELTPDFTVRDFDVSPDGQGDRPGAGPAALGHRAARDPAAMSLATPCSVEAGLVIV